VVGSGCLTTNIDVAGVSVVVRPILVGSRTRAWGNGGIECGNVIRVATADWQLINNLILNCQLGTAGIELDGHWGRFDGYCFRNSADRHIERDSNISANADFYIFLDRFFEARLFGGQYVVPWFDEVEYKSSFAIRLSCYLYASLRVTEHN